MTPVFGASAAEEAAIRGALSRYPAWFVRAARVNNVIVSHAPELRARIALYEHGTRDIYVASGVGGILQKALGHELGHAVDDNFGVPHFFTSTPEWLRIHANQAYFDLPEYRDQPLEYFADQVTKLFLIGPTRLSITNPDEARFLTSWVWPVLQAEFGVVE